MGAGDPLMHDAAAALPRISETVVGSVIADVRRALEDEVLAARSNPARNFAVRTGRRLYSRGESHLYRFRADVAIPLPPESPVQLVIDDVVEARGFLIAVQDFEVLLQLRGIVSDFVPRGSVAVEPWFILEVLSGKLGFMCSQPAAEAAVRLPLALLGLMDPGRNEDFASEAEIRELLSASDRTTLVPNSGQSLAIARCSARPLHFVWGPPGTGKTLCLSHLARLLAARGERVLVLAHSNAAVDSVMIRVADAFERTIDLDNGRILRMGPPQLADATQRWQMLPDAQIEQRQPELMIERRKLDQRIHLLLNALGESRSDRDAAPLAKELEQARRRSAQLRQLWRAAENELLTAASVVGATLSALVVREELWNWRPDAVLIDEASMAGLPSVLAAALRAKKRLILFGDFRQLPPIHLADTPSARDWLGRDVFELAGIPARIDSNEFEPRVTLLETQSRMAPSIARVVSGLAYGGRLKSSSDVAARTAALAECGPWAGECLLLLDTGPLESACVREPKLGSYSRANPLHALAAVALAARALDDGCRQVGLVTPYRMHARLTERLARGLERASDITAATVHRFQGGERDWVLVDLVDAPPESGASHLTGNHADSARRLLNVAVSRARGKLLVLADVGFVRRTHPESSPSLQLLDRLEKNGRRVQLDWDTLCSETDVEESGWASDWRSVQDALADDLEYTSSSAALHLPQGFEPNAELNGAIARAVIRLPRFDAHGAEHPSPGSSNSIHSVLPLSGFFAFFDRRIAYVGGHSPHAPVARVEGPEVVELLEELCVGQTTLPRPRDLADGVPDSR